jgi:glycosyltransferase involved in cell wall biosynthesis
MNLSIAVITFNEERIIEKMLNSVKDLADEIVIVDSFSTDRTAEICRKFSNVKFLQKNFEGYGSQKNFALQQCSGNWILFLDADEIPDAAALKSIKEIAGKQESDFKVYTIEFSNHFLGKELKYGGWGKVFRERFFMKKHGKYSDDVVHETFITSDAIGTLQGKLHHYTYENIFHHLEKSNRYTSMMAEKMKSKGKKASVLKILFAPFFQFFKTYFFRLGFLDGLAGFYIAVTASFYTFLKYMKLYEISKK